MQRIEDYKESLPRDELIRIANEAADELQRSYQIVLTEVMMQETIDQYIISRLKLPSFRKWRSKILPLREAQRSPTRWGIASSDPVAVMLERLEPGDRALVIGGGAERAVYLLAAHDLELVCLFGDTATTVKVEGTLASESLSGRCDAFVVMLGQWLPPEVRAPFHLVVVDVATVQALPRERQRALLLQAQQVTAPEGVHAVVSADAEVAPEGCLLYYQEWQRLPLPQSAPTQPASHKTGPGLRGVLLGCPPIPPSALTPVS